MVSAVKQLQFRRLSVVAKLL